MFAQAHFQIALQLVRQYDGSIPFAAFARSYFAGNRKHGSRDRKQITQLCYAFFRMGHTLRDWPESKRMLTGLFLSATESNPLLGALHAEWNSDAALPLPEKIKMLGCDPALFPVFPWTGLLSDELDPAAFSLSHLRQPRLYVRVRPGYHETVIRRLEEKWISYSEPWPFALALPTGYDAARDFAVNRELVIQDLSSQKTAELFKKMDPAWLRKKPLRLWDACAASGGKSILAVDRLPGIELTVSDIRSSILYNLDKRFAEAGIRNYHRLVVDLSTTIPDIPLQDCIIADLPCSGSGTWARTPEQLCYFDPSRIGHYVALQRRIAGNLLEKLAPGGYLLLVTCSVFRQENEENLEWLLERGGLECISSGVISGAEYQADSMYAALLRKVAD